MKFTCALLMIFGALCGTALAAGKPNIVILLVDDLGHSDAGFTGSKRSEEHTSELQSL